MGVAFVLVIKSTLSYVLLKKVFLWGFLDDFGLFFGFEVKYLGPQIFPRHPVGGSKLEILISHIFELGIFNDTLKSL